MAPRASPMDFAFFEAFRELVGRVELLEEAMLADEDEDEDDSLIDVED